MRSLGHLVLLAAPLAAQCEDDKLLPPDPNLDRFGWTLATSGDTGLVTARTSEGSVFAYLDGGGEWALDQEITAQDTKGGDFFGDALAIHDDVAVIGAWGDDDQGTQSGSAYVFDRQGASWLEDQKLTANDGQSQDRFGHAVGYDGAFTVIGAPLHDAGASDGGAAYVFAYSVMFGNWWQSQKLVPADPKADAQFGTSIDVSGSLVAIGRNEGSGAVGTGAVYVFDQSASWSQVKLVPSDGQPGDHFGQAVALSGNTLLVGAPIHGGTGAVYVFELAGGVWTEVAKLVSGDALPDDHLGWSVDLAGDLALVGALEDGTLGDQAGAAYVFRRAGGVWIELHQLFGLDTTEDDDLGHAVALNGARVWVGAPGDEGDLGAAYQFDLATLGDDCNGNGIPDGCELDCNGNGVPDDCDLASGASLDCNGNGHPDECEVEAYLVHDFDGTALPPGVTETFGGLWHVTPGCVPGDGCASGLHNYCGADATCNYDVGGGSWSYSLNDVLVPANHLAAKLRFCFRLELEHGGFCGHDRADVLVDGQLADAVCDVGDQLSWTSHTVDLAPWAGQTVTITWKMRSDDGLLDDFFGWAIDDLYLGTLGPETDCDGNGLLDQCEIAADPDLDFDDDGVLDVCECPAINYCEGAPNSTGMGGLIGVHGSPSIGLNELTLRAAQCPPGQPGLFFYGPQQQQVPLGDGFLCVDAGTAGLFRLIPAVQVDANGNAQRLIDFTQPPLGGGPGQVDPGSTWNFQFWYRDPAAGGSGSNLTDGIAITFCP